MAVSKTKVDKILEDGERHITVINEKCEKRVTEDKQKHYAQPVLINVETRNIPSGSTVKQEMKKIGPQSVRRKQKDRAFVEPTVVPESAEHVYGAPELHSTLRVGHALFKARDEKPRLPQLLEDKLQSPATNSKFRKEASKGVTVPVKKQIFSELVSVDVSADSLAKQLEEQLHMRATAVRPPIRDRNRVPELSDYFDPESYVTGARVTSSKRYLPFSCVRPQTVKREDYLKLSSHILSKPFR